MIIWILAGAAIVLLVCHVLYDLYLMKVCKLPPGPLSLPLIGNLHMVRPQTMHLSLGAMVEKYGSIFSFRLGPMGRAVFLQDINHIDQIFDSPYAQDRPPMPIFDKITNGVDGIGSCHYDSRWMLMTKTLRKGLAKLSSNHLEQVTMHANQQLINRLLQGSATKGVAQETDNQSYTPKMDVYTTVSAVFSSLIYGIEPEDFDSVELQTRMQQSEIIMSIVSPTHPFNMLPCLWELPSPLKKRIIKCLDERDALFNASFRSHMDNHTGNISDIVDIIASFELNRDSSHDSVTKSDMFLSSWTLYVAGCNTTADTTLWLMLYLCVNTDVQEKIQQEIDAAITDDHTSILNSKQRLHYTRAAILEGLRLASPLALGVPRTVTKDIQIDKYTIPKDTMVMVNQWNVHHDETHWPEPFQFRPERFLDDNGELFSNYHIFQKMPFIPFARGKRNCIGQYIALDMILICFTSVLRQLTLRFPDGYKPDLIGSMQMNLQPCDFPIQCTER